MPGRTTIKLRTLTPIWTGGASGKPERLHETSLIGSLRFWYEVIARGLGLHVCDPTGDDRCQFDTKAYEKARREHKSDDEALREGTKGLCPVCLLFGATGWRRLFQLQVHPAIAGATRPLHFRTTVRMHRNWLGRVFLGEEVAKKGQNGGERKEYRLNSNVWYWQGVREALVVGTRGVEDQYASSQLEGLLSFMGRFGFLGAKPQHGFGQIDVEGLGAGWNKAFQDLQRRFSSQASKDPLTTPFSLERAIFLSFDVPQADLKPFLANQSHMGPTSLGKETGYLPCSFDLRYKGRAGQREIGLRMWLKAKGWKGTRRANELEELDLLLGPRSEWGRGRKKGQIDENLRTGSRVFFGMPVRKADSSDAYSLRIVAFLPLEQLRQCSSVDDLAGLIEAYVKAALPGSTRTTLTLGRDLAAQARGGRA